MPLLARTPLPPRVTSRVATRPIAETLLPSRVSLGRVRPERGRTRRGPPAGCLAGASNSRTALSVSGAGRSTAIIRRWLPYQSSLQTPFLFLWVAGASIHLVGRNQALLSRTGKVHSDAGTAGAPKLPARCVELRSLGEVGRLRGLHAIREGQALRPCPRAPKPNRHSCIHD